MPPKIYLRGQFVTADGGSAEMGDSAAVRKTLIKKGVFLTSTPAAKPHPLPPDLAHFDQAAAAADRLAKPQFTKHAAEIAELARRFQAVRKSLDDVREAKRK
jgi:hypothetical protein